MRTVFRSCEGVNHILNIEVIGINTVLPGQRPGYPGTYL